MDASKESGEQKPSNVILGTQCANCGIDEGPFHEIQWESAEDWEVWCDCCFKEQTDEDTDSSAMSPVG
jgi:hypothetical protein